MQGSNQEIKVLSFLTYGTWGHAVLQRKAAQEETACLSKLSTLQRIKNGEENGSGTGHCMRELPFE